MLAPIDIVASFYKSIFVRSIMRSPLSWRLRLGVVSRSQKAIHFPTIARNWQVVASEIRGQLIVGWKRYRRAGIGFLLCLCIQINP